MARKGNGRRDGCQVAAAGASSSARRPVPVDVCNLAPVARIETAMHTSKTALLPRALAALLLSLPAWVADAADVMVLGTPHLADLQPAALPAQEQRVVETLARFRPTQVCVEAIPGERIDEYVRNPGRYGELLAMFAMDAVRLAPEQQSRRSLDAGAARLRAVQLAAADAPTPAEQALLVSLQLAAFDPWSALLNWSRLDEAGKKAARSTLGSQASDRLEQVAQSRNEMARIAIPLARQLGQRQLCAVDPFADELDVAALADELQPMLADPAIGENIQRFEAWTREGWPSENDGALLRLLGRYNGAEYANRDRAAQWDIFLKGAGDHPAGERRLMLWHARNAAIQHELLRAMAGSNGDRTLLLIGAAHRPYLEASLRALPWVTIVHPLSVIGGPAR
jgi:hypothetical protein